MMCDALYCTNEALDSGYCAKHFGFNKHKPSNKPRFRMWFHIYTRKVPRPAFTGHWMLLDITDMMNVWRFPDDMGWEDITILATAYMKDVTGDEP